MLYKAVTPTKERNFEQTMNENNNQLKEIDKEAREKGDLLHRILKFPYADGYAVYQIVKENKKTVRIKHCTGYGDDWTIPEYGEECSMPKEMALRNLARADALRKLFNR